AEHQILTAAQLGAPERRSDIAGTDNGDPHSCPPLSSRSQQREIGYQIGGPGETGHPTGAVPPHPTGAVPPHPAGGGEPRPAPSPPAAIVAPMSARSAPMALRIRHRFRPESRKQVRSLSRSGPRKTASQCALASSTPSVRPGIAAPVAESIGASPSTSR